MVEEVFQHSLLHLRTWCWTQYPPILRKSHENSQNEILSLLTWMESFRMYRVLLKEDTNLQPFGGWRGVPAVRGTKAKLATYVPCPPLHIG